MNITKLASFSVGPILGALLGFVTLPMLAWYFSPEDVGRFSMLQVALSFGVMLFSLALHQSYVREYNEISDKGQLLALSFWPGIIFLCSTVVLIETLQISVSEIIFESSDDYLNYAVYIGLFLSLIINSLSHVLRMQGRGIAFSLTQVIPRISFLVFIVIIVNAFAKHNFEYIVFSNILALFCSSVLFILLIQNDINNSFKALKNIDQELLNRMLRFGAPLIIGGVAYWALTTIDRIFIQKYAGFDRLGIYAVAVSIASSAAVLTSIFSTLWHPTVYRWAKDGVDVKNVQSVIDFVFIIVLLVWSLVGVFSGLVHFILPPLYSDVQYLLVTCFAAPLLYLISETTMVGIGISRKSNYAMLASILALLAATIFNYLLVPSMAEKGAAISSMLAFAIFLIARTEATCLLWKPLKRKKIYFFLLAYITYSVIYSLVDKVSAGMILLWGGLWLTSVIFYRQRIKFAIDFVRNRNVIDI